MSSYLFIHWPDTDTDRVAWRRQSDQGETPVIHGTLAQLAEQTSGAKVVVLVPSRDILNTRLSVPTQNRKRLMQAIPYAVEDQLLLDPEDQHFALGDQDGEGRLSLAVVERARLIEWLATLKRHAIYPDVIIPDLYALPWEADCWHMAQFDSKVIWRTDAQLGLQCAAPQMAMLLPMLQREYETLPASIVIHQASGETDVSGLFAGLKVVPEVSIEQTDSDVLLNNIVRSGFNPKTVVNLLQGDFSRREQIGKYWRPWQLAASLAAVWFVLNIISMSVNNSQLADREADLIKQTESIYRQAFPQARKVPKPRVQMEQALKKLGSGGGGTETFLLLLSKAGSGIRGTTGLILHNIRYKGGVLDLEVEVPSLQTLDSLKQSLTASNSDLQVEIQSAASRDNRVQGRLQIRKAK